MKYEIKIKLNKLAILLFILSMLEPQYIISFIAPIHYLFRLAYYGAFALMLFDYLRKPIERDQISVLFCIALYFCCRVLSTGLYGGFFNTSSIKMFLTQFILCVGVLYISRELKNCAGFIINCILIWGEIIIYINFITILAFPNGIWQSSATGNACYFLGHKNQLFDYIFLPMLCSLIYHYNRQDKSLIRLWLLWITIAASAFLSSSQGTFMVVCFFFIPTFLISIKYYKIRFSVLWAIVISLALNVGIVFLGIQSSFSWLFDVSFTGRTTIWENILEILPQRLLLGWGDWFDNFNGLSILQGLQSTHNGILSILMYGGILGLFVWVIFNVAVICSTKKYKKNFLCSIFAIVFFAFYIHGIVEASYGGLNMYLLFILAMNIKYLINYAPEKNKIKILFFDRGIDKNKRIIIG